MALASASSYFSVSRLALDSFSHLSRRAFNSAAWNSETSQNPSTLAQHANTDATAAVNGSSSNPSSSSSPSSSPPFSPFSSISFTSAASSDVNPKSSTLLDSTIRIPSEPLDPVSLSSANAPSFHYPTDALPPRSDPLLSFFANLLMKDGKKAQAERAVSSMLRQISHHIHSDPLPAVYSAVDTVRPLVKMQSKKSGGKTLQVPIPLSERQSKRKGLVWIIEASKKRADRKIENRLATEILGVVEGSSSALGKKEELHKIAMMNRSNSSVRV